MKISKKVGDNSVSSNNGESSNELSLNELNEAELGAIAAGGGGRLRTPRAGFLGVGLD
jgi:hypothetical protein